MASSLSISETFDTSAYGVEKELDRARIIILHCPRAFTNVQQPWQCASHVQSDDCENDYDFDDCIAFLNVFTAQHSKIIYSPVLFRWDHLLVTIPVGRSGARRRHRTWE